MDAERLLNQLVALAHELGVEVRVQQLRAAVGHNSGGLVQLKGRRVVFLDSKGTAVDRVLNLADALVPLASLAEPRAPGPEAREVLESARARREGRMAPQETRARAVKVLARPKPGVRKARRPTP